MSGKCKDDIAYYEYKPLDTCFFYTAENVCNYYSIIDSKYFHTSIYLNSYNCSGTPSKQSQDPLQSCVLDGVDGTYRVMEVVDSISPPITTNSIMSTQYLSCNETDLYLNKMIYSPNYCDSGIEYISCNATHYTVAEYGSMDCKGKHQVSTSPFPKCDGLCFVYSCYSMCSIIV